MSERSWSKPPRTPGSVKVSLVDPDTGKTVASTQRAFRSPDAAGIVALELALNLTRAPFAWLTVCADGRAPFTVPVMDPSFPDSSADAGNTAEAASRLWRKVHDGNAEVELRADKTRRIVVATVTEAGADPDRASPCDDLGSALPVAPKTTRQKKGATRHEF